LILFQKYEHATKPARARKVNYNSQDATLELTVQLRETRELKIALPLHAPHCPAVQPPVLMGIVVFRDMK